MKSTLKQLNKLIKAFLNTHSAGNLNELWLSVANQKQVKSLLTQMNKTKDPHAPKRSKSSYLFFCQNNRSLVKNELGDNSKATEVTKELGVRWNKLKVDGKKKNTKGKLLYPKKAAQLQEYIRSAELDKDRYEKEKKEYVSLLKSPVVISQKKKLKRSKSAYLFFCAANRKTVKEELGDNAKATKVTSILGARWNALKAENGTSEFDKLAAEDKKRYEDEKLSTILEEESKLVDEIVKEEIVADKEDAKPEPLKKKKAPKKSTGKKRTGYQVFCIENRAQYKKKYPEEKPSEIVKKLSVAWKKLSKTEKNEYKPVTK